MDITLLALILLMVNYVIMIMFDYNGKWFSKWYEYVLLLFSLTLLELMIILIVKYMTL